MDEYTPYEPSSDFLCLVLNDEIGFGDDPFGRANLATLIALSSDVDSANRDWATMLLVQTGQDSEAIRAALRKRLDDEHEETRLEALIGVAQREPAVALPLVAHAFEQEWFSTMVLEAAAFVADPALLPTLRQIAAAWRAEGDPDLPTLMDAIAACETGVQPDWRREA